MYPYYTEGPFAGFVNLWPFIFIGGIILLILIWAILAAAPASKKGYNLLGYFFLALILGSIGYLHVICLPCYHDSLRAKKARRKSRYREYDE